VSAQPISSPSSTSSPSSPSSPSSTSGTASVDTPARAAPAAARAGAVRHDPARGPDGTPSGGAAARSRLWLVPTPRRVPTAPRAPFVVVLLGLLLVGLVGLLLLNTASAQDAFRLNTLQQQQHALELHRQELARQAGALGDPAQLEAKALTLGMIPVGAPTFLAPGQPLPKGAVVLGDGMVVVPAPLPVWSGALEAVPSSPTSSKPPVKPPVTPPVKPSAKAMPKPSAVPSPSAQAPPKPLPAARPSATASAGARSSPAAGARPTSPPSVRTITPAAPVPAPAPAPLQKVGP